MILTVQPARKKSEGIFRLGFDSDDSERYFKKGQKIELVLAPNIRISVNIACGPPTKKGFDVNSKILSKWIKDRDFDKYPDGDPTKLDFSYQKQGVRVVLTFLRKVRGPKSKNRL